VEIGGKTALVTGGARRLGASIARALAEARANVVVHYHRSAAEAERLVQDITARGVQAWALSEDLKTRDGADRLFAAAVEIAGPIDILVNSASVFGEDDLRGVSAEAIEANVRLHAWTPLELSRRLAQQDREAVIVNLLDTRIVDYDRQHVAYHLSKRALDTVTHMSALEFAPKVRVNAVAPGVILPPEGKGEDYLRALAKTNPLQGHGCPEDVAEAVLFLVRSEFITGQVIFVDGGRHMKGCVYG